METNAAKTERKTRTITLTDARPVKIVEDEWPIIASAETWREHEASEKWSVRVREHDDGRRIVYGVRQSGGGGMPLGYRGAAGGSIVPARDGAPDDDATIAAIRAVADEVIDDAQLGDECIADLPAREI